MLFENGYKVCFRNIIGESAVAEDECTLASGSQLFMPSGNAEGLGLDSFLWDFLVEANENGSCSDGMHCFVSDGVSLDGNAEVETKF